MLKNPVFQITKKYAKSLCVINNPDKSKTVTQHVITFDTLQYVKRLKAAGVPEKQAEAQAMLEKKQTDDICAFIDNSLATKQGIKELKLELELKIELVRKDLLIKLSCITGSMLAIAVAMLDYLIKLH
jgi:hypothetical protein